MTVCRALGPYRLKPRGSFPRSPTARQVDVLPAFVATGGSLPEAAARVGIRPSTAQRHLADLRARSGFTTEQLICRGRAEGWLVVGSLESSWAFNEDGTMRQDLPS